jgi:hypothetical protein
MFNSFVKLPEGIPPEKNNINYPSKVDQEFCLRSSNEFPQKCMLIDRYEEI